MKILPRSRKVDNYLKEPVVFYCKDCEKIVKVKPVGRKFVYRCAVCGTKNVAFGTANAIKNYYRFEEETTPAVETAGEVKKIPIPIESPAENTAKPEPSDAVKSTDNSGGETGAAV